MTNLSVRRTSPPTPPAAEPGASLSGGGRAQRERLTVLGIAIASYALDTLWLAALAREAVVAWWVPVAYAGPAILANLLFLAIFLPGYNQRFRDPSLTLPQGLFGYALQITLLALAPRAGLLFLGTMFVVSAFTALTMTVRQYVTTWLAVGTATGIVLSRVADDIQLTVHTPAQRTLAWMIFTSILGRVILLNVRVAGLREAIRGRNRELRALADRTAQESADRLKAERELHEAQKLESVGRLAGGVAHDLNNLLTVVLGHAAMLEPVLADAQARSDLGQITAAAERAARLTTQLLTFARRQVGQPRTIQLNQVVSQLEPMLRQLMGEQVTSRFQLAPDLWPLWADPAQLELVLVNLALNARDAMPGGGVLTISTRNMELAAGDGRARTGLEPGEYVQLAVQDTGVGIPPELLPHIFEPFFTTKELGKGTGLGLPSCYGVARQWGGDISVSSNPGEGTRFELIFPRAAPGDPHEPAPDQEAVPTGHGELILVVEDRPELRAVTRRVLEGAGYRVAEAGDGEEALGLLEVRATAADLVLSDVVMPRLNGRALADHLRRTRPALPVLLMSGYSESALSRSGLLGTGHELILKPFTPAMLLRAVHRRLAERAGR